MTRAGRILAGGVAALALVAGVAAAGVGGPQEITVPNEPVDVELARMNGAHSRLDAVVTSLDAGVLSILPGRPNGLGQPQTINVPGDPRFLALGRVNGDKLTDGVYSDATKSNAVRVFLKRRGAGFAIRVYRMGMPVGDIDLGDVNGDGRTDLVAGSPALPEISVRLQKTNGRFGPAKVKPAGDADGDAENLVVGDLDRDGRADAVLSDRQNAEVTLFYGRRRGLGGRVQHPTGGPPAGLAIGRVNPGKAPDLVAANRGAATASVLYGRPNGSLKPVVDYPVGGSLIADVAITNVDGGRPDLVLTRDFAGNFALLRGQPGGFAAAENFVADIGVARLAAGRIDGDGSGDFAGVSFSGDSVTAYFGG